MVEQDHQEGGSCVEFLHYTDDELVSVTNKRLFCVQVYSDAPTLTLATQTRHQAR